METKSQIQRFSRTITFKFILVGIISLMLLIPAGWIKKLILERQMRSEEAFTEISSIWGNSQHIAGPVLTVPYITYEKIGDELLEEHHRAHFLPETLKINGIIHPTKRYRGIFMVVVYGSDLNIRASFGFPDFEDIGSGRKDILWDQAYVSVGIPDMRGIQNDVPVKWNDRTYNVIPGSKNDDIIKSGFHTKVALSPEAPQDSYNFSTDLSLNGTRTLSIYPVGKKTEVRFTSSWPSPSFNGNFLPDDRNIDDKGFEAEWLVTHLNRNFPQSWSNNKYSIKGSDFGVELIQPADHYQRSYRSVKYAMMFISLTFLLFILIEILNRKKLHPIQYFLNGLALVVFYSLLVSLSEQIGFSLAYLLSSAATIMLISYYIYSNFGKVKYAIITCSILAGLYLFLFIILRLEDYALLFGSIGLFLVLAIFMILTRRINWYKEDSAEISPA